MNCPRCQTSLPDGARFCYKCGAATGASPPPAPGAAAAASTSAPAARPSVGSSGVQELKCPGCGAPLHPVFGEMVLTCEYCGGSVSLGGDGWKEVNKHTMLAPKILAADQAGEVIRQMLDQGFMHRHDFESSKLVEQKLSYVPFWVLPVSATTNYVYSDVAVGVGTTVGTIAAASLISGALGGQRGGGYYPMPMMMGAPVNSNRQAQITGQYEFPVVAVKGMSMYQPKNYEFALSERSYFDHTKVPAGTPVLNGDLGEDAAQHSARALVMQLQADQAHAKHHMVSQLQTQAEVSEGELMHVPVWYVLLEREAQRTIILIDAHAGRVLNVVS